MQCRQLVKTLLSLAVCMHDNFVFPGLFCHSDHAGGRRGIFLLAHLHQSGQVLDSDHAGKGGGIYLLAHLHQSGQVLEVPGPDASCLVERKVGEVRY